MTGLVRGPRRRLAGLVESLWVADAPTDDVEGWERMLPAATPHVVIRLSDTPAEIHDEFGTVTGYALVGGPRSTRYLRRRASGRTVGATLSPHGFTALFGPGRDFVGRHVPLEDAWGRVVPALIETLAGIGSPTATLTAFEEVLVGRATKCPPSATLFTAAARRIAAGDRVSDVVSDSGYSHRTFAATFRSIVGLAPKTYGRLCRFGEALRLMRVEPDLRLATLAFGCGYSDQAHLSREFRRHAGMTLMQYRASAVEVGSRHVRCGEEDQFSSRLDEHACATMSGG